MPVRDANWPHHAATPDAMWPVDTFWSYVERDGGDYGCWDWQADVNESGYGIIWLSDGRWVSASRYAFMLTYGPLPQSVKVSHPCGNTLCCNAAHMWAGSTDSDERKRERNQDEREYQRDAQRFSGREVYENQGYERT